MNDLNINPKAVVIQLCVTALSCCLCYIFYPMIVSHPNKSATFAASMWFSIMIGILSGPIIRKFVK